MIDEIYKTVINNKDKIAYMVNDEYITYENLWEAISKYSDYLKREGTSPVIIYGHKEISVFISMLSCLMAKRAYVPVLFSTPKERLEKIVNDSKSSIIITNEKISIDNINILKLEDLKKHEKEDIKENDNKYAYIMFTSGSTGSPKGVPISYENLDNFVKYICAFYPLSDYKNIKVLDQVSFSFDVSIADIYYSLVTGQTIVALDKDISANYEEIFNVLSKVDVIVTTPTFIRLCMVNKDFNSTNYPLLKCIYLCGEQVETRCARSILSAFPNVKLINAYGPTEATSAVSAVIITKEMLNDKLLPVGREGNYATDIEIIDDEIVLKGKSVFNGYLNLNSDNYYVENDINCYKTGDIGYIKDGYLYCVGRKDNQIKYKGYRIELSEIEHYLNEIEEVKECACIAKYTEENIVKTIKAFVVLNTNVDENYIKEELSKNIPDYMIPKTIEFMEELPINQNGKIDRKALSNL